MTIKPSDANIAPKTVKKDARKKPFVRKPHLTTKPFRDNPKMQVLQAFMKEQTR